MAILKSFHVQIVSDQTKDAAVITDLGPCVIPILVHQSDIPTTTGTNVGTDYLAQYTDDYKSAGGAVMNGDPSRSGWDDAFANLLLMAPITVDRNIFPYRATSYYLRLMSDSGYYVAGSSTLNAGSFSLNRLYDASGTLMDIIVFVQQLNASQIRMPLCCFYTGAYTGDTITDLNQKVEASGRSSGNPCQVAVSNVGPSVKETLIQWLNGCSTQKEDKPQTITVSWARPGDGKVLTDTYDIDVAPPSATTGGESGGSGSGSGSGEGGGGGGHSF